MRLPEFVHAILEVIRSGHELESRVLLDDVRNESAATATADVANPDDRTGVRGLGDGIARILCAKGSGKR